MSKGERGVHTPSVDENLVAILGRKGVRVVDSLPGELREGLSEDHITTDLQAESVLLAVGGIPDPVDEEISDIHGDKGILVPGVGVWVMVRKVDRAVAVAEGHTGKVPEDQHESPFLIVDVPEIGNQSVNYTVC